MRDDFDAFCLSKSNRIKEFDTSETIKVISVCFFMVLFLVCPTAFSVSPKDLLCMAGAIQAEAENQTLKGQLAVGCVILNRWKTRKWVRPGQSNTYCNITRKGQFVRVIPNKTFETMAKEINESKCNAEGLSDLIGFFKSSVKPKKGSGRVCPAPESVKIIGDHTFYSKVLHSCPSNNDKGAKSSKDTKSKKSKQTPANFKKKKTQKNNGANNKKNFKPSVPANEASDVDHGGGR